MDLLASLLEDLRSPDAGVRFSVLSRLETLTWTPELAAALRQRAATETDPATRFHLDLLIQFDDTASPSPAPGSSLAALTTLLANPDPDWLQVGLLLRRTPADELPLVMPLVREQGLGAFPDGILPFILRLFRQHGSREDVPALEALTRHPSPRVILAAVEALERLDPEHLGTLITPLLRHPSPGIQSVAIRLLFRIDPPQARRHFEALLFSEDPLDREAALFHAYFFPFPQIVQILLRFLSLEEDPALIRKAGRLFIINPAPELPERLIDLLATSRGDKQRELKIILQGVVEFLIKAGLSTRTAEEWRADLIALYHDRQAARWLGEATRLLGSPDETTRRAGVARLADLSRAGHQPARAALHAHAAREPSPALQTTIAALLAEATATEPAPENPPVAVPLDEGPTSPHERPAPDPAIALRDRLWRDFRRAPPAARPGVLRMLVARAGPAALELCREGLTSPDPVLVGAALEGLTALAPDDLPTLLIERLPTAPLEVQPLFVKALAPVRKSAALETVRQLLFSVQPARRLAGIQAAATLDRPAVQEIVVQAFTRESASDVFQGLADLLLSWMDEELFRTLAAHWPPDRRPAPVAAFLQQAAAALATARPTRFSSAAAVLAQLDPPAPPPPSPSAPRADYDFREVAKTRPSEPPPGSPTAPPPPLSPLACPPSPSFPAPASADQSLPVPPTDGSGDLENWAEADPVTRFQMLARLGTEPATPTRLAEIRHWVSLETEPISRFHLELTGARWAAATSRPGPPATPLATLETALASPVQRSLDLALALEQMPRRDRALAMDLLREAGWHCLPTPLLPFVLAFVRRAGSPADGPTVEAFCHHDDPRIVLAAIDALEVLNPEDLKPLLPFFLVHAHRAIRLRAIRLLDKWDRPEALAHLAATLGAEDPAERAAALDQALLLPFPAVKPLLLRFLGLESDPALVAKAGRLFQINPDPEVPAHLAELLATSGPERRLLLSGILSGVLTALAAAGLVPDSPAEQLERLTATVQARRQARDLEHCRAALTASTPEARLAGVRLAAALAEEGLPGLLELIRAQAARETDPTVAAALRTLLAHLQSSPAVDVDIAAGRSAGPAQPPPAPPATATPTLPTTDIPGAPPSPEPPITTPTGPSSSERLNTSPDRSGLPPSSSPSLGPLPEAPDPDNSPAARVQWLNTLSPLTFPAALPRLRRWLDTLPDAEREPIVDAYGRCATREQASDLRRLLKSHHPPLLAAVLRVFARLPPEGIASLLPRFLSHADPQVAEAAVRALLAVDKRQALLWVEQMLGSGHPRQRATGLNAAGWFAFPEIRALLLGVWERETQPDLLTRVLALLRPHLDRPLLSDLVQLAGEAPLDPIRDEFLREAARTIVGPAADPEAAADLLAALREAAAARRATAPPPYAFSRIQALRRPPSPPPAAAPSALPPAGQAGTSPSDRPGPSPQSSPASSAFWGAALEAFLEPLQRALAPHARALATGGALIAAALSLGFFLFHEPEPHSPPTASPTPILGAPTPDPLAKLPLEPGQVRDIESEVEAVDGEALWIRLANGGERVHLQFVGAPPRPYKSGDLLRGRILIQTMAPGRIEALLLRLY